MRGWVGKYAEKYYTSCGFLGWVLMIGRGPAILWELLESGKGRSEQEKFKSSSSFSTKREKKMQKSLNLTTATGTKRERTKKISKMLKTEAKN